MENSTSNRPRFDEQRSAAIRKQLVNMAERGTAENQHYKNVRFACVLVPSAAAALALTAGTIALLEAPVTEKFQIACFARAERSGDSFPGGTVVMQDGRRAGEAAPTSTVEIEDALATCSDLWKQHSLDADDPNGIPGPPAQRDRTFSYPVPSPLTVCVWDGMAAVVPGDSNVCAKLGLAEMIPAAAR